jgi:hypothetical protein
MPNEVWRMLLCTNVDMTISDRIGIGFGIDIIDMIEFRRMIVDLMLLIRTNECTPRQWHMSRSFSL